MTDIRSLGREEIQAVLASLGEPAYRAGQLLQWLYPRRAAAWGDMTNLPRALRERLAAEFRLHLPALVTLQGSPDSTRKFLWRLADGALVESVLIPANPALYGEASDRHTLCVSTQVGCAYGCKFCASGLDGWKRNLGSEEIVGQVLAVERWHQTAEARTTMPAELPCTSSPKASTAPDAATTPSPDRLINNLVIMGMGEPFANYDNLLKALRLLNAPWGGGIGARKITVSTSGLAPQIRRFADEPEQFRLAISLHGATDAVRGQIMPVNRRHPLAELVAASEHYLRHKGRTLTFEYILIAGVNDDDNQAAELATLARRLNAKVNLIPYNPVDGLAWRRPEEGDQDRFLELLSRQGVKATLRREKGMEIDAACGQLRLKAEQQGSRATTV